MPRVTDPSPCLSVGALGMARGTGMDTEGLKYCSSCSSEYLTEAQQSLGPNKEEAVLII